MLKSSGRPCFTRDLYSFPFVGLIKNLKWNYITVYCICGMKERCNSLPHWRSLIKKKVNNFGFFNTTTLFYLTTVPNNFSSVRLTYEASRAYKHICRLWHVSASYSKATSNASLKMVNKNLILTTAYTWDPTQNKLKQRGPLRCPLWHQTVSKKVIRFWSLSSSSVDV